MIEYINPQGKLEHLIKEVKLETVQHAREIMRDRRTDNSLRNKWFWTSDFPLYTLENGKSVIYLANTENNLLFQNIEEGTCQLRQNNNYFPKEEDFFRVIKSNSTLRTEISDLKLQSFFDEWSFFEIETNNYNILNNAQRKLAEKVYGEGEDFKTNMKILRDSEIITTEIYLLNPNYVEKTLNKRGSKGLSRFSLLSNFDNNSNFLADNNNVDGDRISLRGIKYNQ